MKLLDLLFGKMIDRRIAAFQDDMINRHSEEVESMYRTMRGWRHDYHNHIQTMLALVEAMESPEAKEADIKALTKPLRDYLLSLNDDLTTVDTVIKTGNIMVDAILNSKLSLIRSKEIGVHAKAVVPVDLAVSDVDLCSIIGNLLDNALEACLRQKDTEERFIRVYVGIMKQQLYISVTNSASGRAAKKGKVYTSSKGSGEENVHGFGLSSIDRTVKKCGGYVNRQDDEGVFATEILLPLKQA